MQGLNGNDSGSPVVTLGERQLTIEDVLLVADGLGAVELNPDPGYRAFVARGHEVVRNHISNGGKIYGVNTGFGDSCVTDIPDEFLEELPTNLVRYHGCGVGGFLDPAESAAVVVVRGATLALGYSAVRPVLLEQLVALLNYRILPRIPRLGSVGASGDLTPLSYVAAALIGEREVFFRDEVMPAASALEVCGLSPLRLAPKEGLALMNGTTVMAALGCLAFRRAEYLGRLACALTAMMSDVTRGNPTHFHDRMFELKPHPGMRVAARLIREDIYEDSAPEPGRLQDRYSVRCAPHVIGVLLDALPWMRSTLEIEVNGASDNPLVDPDTGEIFHGGNFYGGHICFALDALKIAVANIGDLLDRQLVLLCQPTMSNGLPTDLVALPSPASAAHHGFKAMQITASALAAEALKLTMPASVFSRSTENHNQDKVSMGTIAANDCLRILELVEIIAAVHLLALAQAVDLREGLHCGSRTLVLRDAVRRVAPMNTGDRRQDLDIDAVTALISHQAIPVGQIDLSDERFTPMPTNGWSRNRLGVRAGALP
jgi:histidine ammonia-lyase